MIQQNDQISVLKALGRGCYVEQSSEVGRIDGEEGSIVKEGW